MAPANRGLMQIALHIANQTEDDKTDKLYFTDSLHNKVVGVKQ